MLRYISTGTDTFQWWNTDLALFIHFSEFQSNLQNIP